MSQPRDWKIFHGDQRVPHEGISDLPDPPGWRPFGKPGAEGNNRRKKRGETFRAQPEHVQMVNAALYLRRPLLITGKPGTGKSSLAYAVARELNLGEVLYWPITTRTTLEDGLYSYDAIGRLQEAKQINPDGSTAQDVDDPAKIAKYITLGPLGTALLPSERPRVLVIDEIDKSDIDLPNNLLTIFEEGRFEIRELARLGADADLEKDSGEAPSIPVRTAFSDADEPATYRLQRAPIPLDGRVICREFPLVILTSNGERDFPPPFLRRCLRLDMAEPDRGQLEDIVRAHFDDCDVTEERIRSLIDEFELRRKQKKQLATDQLLNALFILARDRQVIEGKEGLENRLLAPLDRPLERLKKRSDGSATSRDLGAE